MKKALAPNTREHLDQLRRQLDQEFVFLLGMIGIVQEKREHERDTYLDIRHRIYVISDLLDQINDMLAIQQFLEDPTSTNVIVTKLYHLLGEEETNVKKRKSRSRNKVLQAGISGTQSES
jgi:hypothetical protein